MRDDPKNEAWRFWWAGEVALLRAVGHVLHKVDTASDPTLSRAVDQWWHRLRASEPEPSIFWGFMESERNLLLKEGKVNPSKTVSLTIDLSQGRSSEGTHTHRLNTGPFADREPCAVVQEAIDWWNTQINSIELTAQKTGSITPE
jgi:hypothetical protein